MGSKFKKLGSSLQVPDVQELAKEKSNAIPPRYQRPNQDQIISSLPENRIPVIDMQKLMEKDSMDTELQKLHTACQEWGFFQLINHGVSFPTLEKMKLEIQEFFSLPIEEKKKFSQESGDLEGYGQAFVVSEEQKLDWADLFFAITLPIHLRKPHLIPKLPTKFRDAIDEYATEMKNLAVKILDLMAKALHMKAEEMNTVFEEGMQSMRMNYYPPCPQPELVTGLYPHSDATGLTILLQVNEIEGLQVKKDGAWIPVVPFPNAFVINIGDILEIVTNGIYRSIEHRATVNLKKERLSIATFFNPNIDGDFGPAPSIVTPETPAKFKRISFVDYMKGYFSRELDGKSYLDTIRI
ncbi:Iron ascorbate family oxidoreductase [Olea europaea subsp. europaea]|uniref:Iron ascorbate family oxidoreductase n=1 Tax=Olea europaea subsp. europaea TaxID=158383 RepID=A0A8S0SXB1_OLEEU|nr:Iron ascorbate family oxidoreductase [Olea europaea subsp. europaea]